MAKKPTAEQDAAPMLALIDQDAPEGGPLVVQPGADAAEQAKAAAALVYVDPVRFDQFYERMKAETDKHVPDVTTAAGREAIRKLAFGVTKTKTSLDKAGLELTADWRAKTKSVNAARGPIVARLTALADEVRKPLTDWENAEAARIAANEAVVADIRNGATVTSEDTAETVEARGRRIWAITFPADTWLPAEIEVAEAAKRATVGALVAAKKRLVQEEADRAELAALRKEREEREERDRLAQIERERIANEERIERERAAEEERAERQRREDEAEAIRQREAEEERQRLAEEQRQRDAAAAIEQAARDAADKARREAEEEAERLRQKERDEAEEKLAIERRERERLEQLEREREAEAQRKRDADAAAAEADRQRQADAEHRRTIIAEAVSDVVAACAGLPDDMARDIVNAIASGQVRHAAVSF
jgi:colicin import membrane protein